MKTLKWIVFVILYLSLLAYAASAQTVSPPIAEHHGKMAKGEFVIRNDGLTPLDVKIEPLSFDVDAQGNPHFRPLDVATIHLKMDSFTGRIGAKQQKTFFYSVECFQRPC
jgi:hypothetical protein